MVRHRFQFDEVGATLCANLVNDLLESRVHAPFDNRAAVLWAPDDVVSATVDDVVVGSDCDHVDTIHILPV